MDFPLRVVALADVEDDERDRHQDRREDEGRAVAPAVTHQRQRRHRAGSANVDGRVEPGEGLGPQLGRLAGFVVHLPHERADVGLDRARSAGQQHERDVEREFRAPGTEDEVTTDVGHREVDDGLELAEVVVRHVPTEQRRQVARGREQVHDRTALLLGEAESLDHVQRQQALHAVEAGALGELAPEDEVEANGVFPQLVEKPGHEALSQWDEGC